MPSFILLIVLFVLFYSCVVYIWVVAEEQLLLLMQLALFEVFCKKKKKKKKKKKNLDQLISKMALGQHAILLKLWITEVSAVYIVCNIVIAIAIMPTRVSNYYLNLCSMIFIVSRLLWIRLVLVLV